MDFGLSQLSSPQPVTGLEVTLYKTSVPSEHDIADMYTPKRFAVAGPGRLAIDYLQESMRIAQEKRRMTTIQYKQERLQMEREMNDLRAQLSSSGRERQAFAAQLREMELHFQNLKDQFEAKDVENSLNETEMAEQILQFEKEVEQYKSTNLSLEEQMAALQTKYDKDMEINISKVRSDSQREINEQRALLRAEFDRENLNHENELNILRKRLEQISNHSNSAQYNAEALQAPAGTSHSRGVTSRNGPSTAPARSQPLASLNAGGGPVSMPRHGAARSRKSRLFSVLQHPGPAVGVVPLQVSSTNPSMIPTPTPLSSLPPHSNLATGHSPLTAMDPSLQVSPTNPSMIPTPTPLLSLPPYSNLATEHSPLTATGPLSPDIVSLVVKSTLEQIGIQAVEVAETRRRARGRTSLGQKREDIQKQQMMISGVADKEWKDVVRRFWRQRYNTRTADDFFDYIPASNDLVAACRNSSSVPPDVFQLDFGKSWEKSMWNRTILRRISDDILTERETDGAWGLPDVSEDYLLGLLYMQLKRSRDAWSRMQPRFLSDNNRGETAQEAAERVIGQTEQRYQANSSRSRRKRKYEKRVKAVEEVITIKTSEDAVDLEAWHYFRGLLERLSVDGMSSEEDAVRDVGGQKVTVFLVKLCVWRAEEITQYLKFIDTEANRPIFQDNRGVKACARIPADTPSSLVPHGLPRNMYHTQWLTDLESRSPDYVLDELRVSEEAFELLKLVAPS